jgi:hypothetical protein
MFKRILIGIAVIVAVFAAFVASRPSTYKIERSIVMDAPAARPYASVVDFHRWDGWSPWAKLDPAMKVDFAGPESGVGATYHWKGNDKVGEGRMTITGAVPDQRIDVKLEFLKPWEQTSLAVFTFAPDPGGTKVTWTMSGKYDFVGKLFAVFMDMDGMVGPDFEKGLQALKERSRE